jgi:putative tricarboxylic transport membrane protein
MIVIAGGVFYQTREMPKEAHGTLGAAQWPRFIAIVLLIFTGILALQTAFLKKDTPSPLNLRSPGMKRVFALFGVLIAFGILMPIVGFLLASFLFIIATMLVMGERKKSWIFGSSIGITVGIYIVFEYLLKLMLPRPFFL